MFFSLTLDTNLSRTISGILSVGALVFCGCFNTVSGVPASVAVDTGDTYCTSETFLRVQTSFLFSSLLDKL